MTIYGAFNIPTLGMMSQSHALNSIGNNIANINTGGFKRTDTRFSTMISKTYGNQSDIGGLRPNDYNRIDVQGSIVGSSSPLDLAINGHGFFVLNTKQDGSGQQVYTRDGGFGMVTGADIQAPAIGSTTANPTTITVKEGYLVDKNNNYVQGYSWNAASGAYSTTLSSLRIDPYIYSNVGEATTTANLALNLPANNANIIDASGNSNHVASVTAALAGTNIADLEVYNISVVDSNFASQSASLYFSKDSTNTWSMSAATQYPAVQVDTVTLAGTIEAGDTYTLTINNTNYSYSTLGTEANIDAVRDALITSVNADTSLAVTAAAGGAGQLTLTGNVAGTAFSESSTATHGGTSSAQSDSITIGGTFELGDAYTATVNGTTYTYTSAGGDTTNADAATGLAALINANGAVSATSTGAVLTIVANVAGTSYTLASVGASGGADTTQTATSASIATALNDNTATSVNTTLAQTVTRTPVTTMTFDGKGQLLSPTSVSLALSFANSGTATVAVDISKLSQFAAPFLTTSYSNNGFPASQMKGIEFDTSGQIIGKFFSGKDMPIHQLPLAQFRNANAMDRLSGNVFAQTPDSGTATLGLAGAGGYASFIPSAHELSNVDMASEFSKMIMTQAAYNASANVFKTVDEMSSVARDLKR